MNDPLLEFSFGEECDSNEEQGLYTWWNTGQTIQVIAAAMTGDAAPDIGGCPWDAGAFAAPEGEKEVGAAHQYEELVFCALWAPTNERHREPLQDADLFLRAAEALRAHCPDQASILKIMVLPEFFFRGPNEAEEINQAAYIRLRDCLIEQFNHPQWAHWLFFCGTVVSQKPFARGKGAVGFNTLLVVQGGPGERDRWRPYDKRKFSSTDGMGTKREAKSGRDPAAAWKWFKRDVPRFELDGIVFGMEICLDHAARRLREPVDVQVLVACGMPLEMQLAAVPGGYFFRCDGDADADADAPCVQLAQVRDSGLPEFSKLERVEAQGLPKSMVVYKSEVLKCVRGVDPMALADIPGLRTLPRSLLERREAEDFVDRVMADVLGKRKELPGSKRGAPSPTDVADDNARAGGAVSSEDDDGATAEPPSKRPKGGSDP